MFFTRSRRRHAVAALAVTVSLVVAACGDSDTSAPTDSAYAALRVQGLEVESYGSLREMAGGADMVVIGKFTSFDISRTVRGDAAQDVVVYGKATLVVTRKVVEEPVATELPVEFLLPYGPDEAATKAAEFAADLPKEEVLVFLRHKGGAEAGLYRLVNSLGLWTSTARAALDTPLAEEAPASGPYKGELAGIGSIDELADQLSTG
jgi:hypothetical protein